MTRLVHFFSDTGEDYIYFSFTIFQSLLKFMSIGLVMLSSHLILGWPLLLWLQFFPASESFPVNHLFASGSQSIGTLASASVLPMNIQDWFPLGLTRAISLQSKGLARIFCGTTVWKHLFFGAQPSFFMVQLSHLYVTNIRMWLLEKPLLWRYRPLLAKWCLWFLIHCLS